MNADERVRIEVLHSALLAQMDLPLDIIKDLAQHDVSAKIRSIALAGLVNRSEQVAIELFDVFETLVIAQNDTDPEVLELAVQLMKYLEEASADSDNHDQQEQSLDPQSEWIPLHAN